MCQKQKGNPGHLIPNTSASEDDLKEKMKKYLVISEVYE